MKGATEVPVLAEIASEVGASVYAVTVAWLRSLSPQMLVMPGVTRVASALDAVSGLKIDLSSSQLERIKAGLPESEPMHHELLTDQPRV